MTQLNPTVIGPALPNIPWEERPAESNSVVWRSARNPIISHDHIPGSNSIFNSAVAPFNHGFAGVFRCDNKKRQMNLHRGRSLDGIKWEIDDAPIEWKLRELGIPFTPADVVRVRETVEAALLEEHTVTMHRKYLTELEFEDILRKTVGKK